MIARLYMLAGVASVVGLFACSSPPPIDGGGENTLTRNGNSGGSSSSSGSSGSADFPAPTETDSGALPSTTPPASDAGVDAPPADCAASCIATLAPKCAGDDAFCADVCASMTASQIACLVAAPSCDKSAWTTCVPDDGSDDPGAGKGK